MFAVIFLGEKISVMSATGIGLIAIGSVLIALG
jgi:uncharacterized membrane protein